MEPYHVFLASPGDMKAERAQVRAFFEQYNRNIAQHRGIRFDVLDYEHYGIPGVGRPQGLITRQTMLRYQQSLVLFIGLLGQRFGTATGGYESGTEEEFETAMALRRELGDRPEIMLFFRNNLADGKTPNLIEMKAMIGQWDKVNAFRERIEREGPGQLYTKGFESSAAFPDLFSDILSRWLNLPEQRWNRGVDIGHASTEQTATSSPTISLAPGETGGSDPDIQGKAEPEIARLLKSRPGEVLSRILAETPGLADGRSLAGRLCELAASAHLESTLDTLHKATARAREQEWAEGRPADALCRVARDILGWLVVLAVTRDCRDEQSEAARAWVMGSRLQVPLRTEAGVEVLMARWRGGKAEFSAGHPSGRGAYNLTQEIYQDPGFDDPRQFNSDRLVLHIKQLLWKRVLPPPIPGSFDNNADRDLAAALDKRLKLDQQQYYLVLNQNDRLDPFNLVHAHDAIQRHIPKIRLVLREAQREEDAGIFVIPERDLMTGIQQFLLKFKDCGHERDSSG